MRTRIPAQQAGDDEGDHDPGAGEIRGGPPGEDENAGADDAADAEQDQVERAEAALELAAGMFGLHLRHRLADEQAAQAGNPPRRAGGT
jgi:hypothetical protein